MSLWPTITYDATGLHAWAENLSSTGRRQATSVAASKLRQWVNGTNEERPSRGEIKAWDLLVLNERRELHNRVEALTKENEALTAQRDDLIEEERTAREASTIHAKDADRCRAERDEALEALGEVGRLRFEVEGLHQTVAHVCRARDEALEALALARETVVRQVGRYEELRTAYDAAEAERNTLAKCGGGEK